MSATCADPPLQDAPAPSPVLRPMRDSDLGAVLEIELRAYPFPWTRGIFEDCLRAAYPAWVLVDDATIVGYAVLSVAAGEAHVLNICVDPRPCTRCCTWPAAAARNACSWKCARPTAAPWPCTTPKASTRSAAARATTPPKPAAKTPSSWQWNYWKSRARSSHRFHR